MEDLIGVYGILDRAHWPEAPFQLLDGGVETDTFFCPQSDGSAFEYRKECRRDCSGHRFFQ